MDIASVSVNAVGLLATVVAIPILKSWLRLRTWVIVLLGFIWTSVGMGLGIAAEVQTPTRAEAIAGTVLMCINVVAYVIVVGCLMRMHRRHSVQTRNSTMPSFDRALDAMSRYAKSGLGENMITWRGKSYLTAGAHQFHSLWTRDAAWSARALMLMGRADVVENHARLYLTHMIGRAGPKGFDWRSNTARVVRRSLEVFFDVSDPPLLRVWSDAVELIPIYEDERGSRAIDSNLMTLLAISELPSETRKRLSAEFSLRPLFDYYETYRDSRGLVHQTAYSDWQDSQRREGCASLTNLLYYEVARRYGWMSDDAQRRFAAAYHRAFFIANGNGAALLRTLEGDDRISLDVNLLALRFEVIRRDSYVALKTHPLWTGENDDAARCVDAQPGDVPGFVSWPNYPKFSSFAPLKWVGMQHYHDSVYWSWLIALSAETAFRMGDVTEGRRVACRLYELCVRDGGIAEIYAHRRDLPMFRSFLYESELPFSWGSAFTLELTEFVTSGTVKTAGNSVRL